MCTKRMKLPVMATAAVGALLATSAYADVIWDQSELITDLQSPTVGCPSGGANGTPPGDVSSIQAAGTLLGFGADNGAAISGNPTGFNQLMADEFVLCSPASIDKITFYSYQTANDAFYPASTITGASLRINQGFPGSACGSVVYGDGSTNVMSSTQWSGIYRTSALGLDSCLRMIQEVEIEFVPPLNLGPGVYWLEVGFDGSMSSGPWMPPRTTPGDAVTGNGMQSLDGGSTYGAAQDAGNGGQKGVPFKVEGTGGACGGGFAPEDLNMDEQVNVTDLLLLLTAWGACPGCPEDLNGDNTVNVTDLLQLLAAWGPAPGGAGPPPPPNDDVINACIFASYGVDVFDTQYATPDSVAAQCSAGRNIWYLVTAADGASRVEVDNGAQVAVYSADGSVLIDCQAGAVDFSSTPGTDYLVEVNAGAGGAPEPGTFEFRVGAGPNDLCENAIEAFDGVTAIDTTSAGTDGPLHASCQYGNNTWNDIWYFYQPADTGFATVNTCEAVFSYDTDLVAYDMGTDDLATVCADLENPARLVACNDDAACVVASFWQSEMRIPMRATNKYLIRVGGYASGDRGLANMNISFEPGPINDECAGADPLAIDDPALAGSTEDLTPDPTGTLCEGNVPSAPGVWFTFTGNGGKVTVTTCSTSTLFATNISVFCGDCAGLRCVGYGALFSDIFCADTPTFGDAAQVTFCSQPDVPYYVLVHGDTPSEEGDFEVTVTSATVYSAPGPCTEYPDCGIIANDSYENALPIDTGLTEYTTDGAGTDGPAHLSCEFDGQTYHDIWFQFTPASSGDILVTTCPALGGDYSYDTDLVIYDGCPTLIGDLVLLACNDDESGCPGFSSAIGGTDTGPVAVTGGNCYVIRVGGWGAGDQGEGILFIDVD